MQGEKKTLCSNIITHEVVTECYEEHWSREQKEYLDIRIMTIKLRHKREEM